MRPHISIRGCVRQLVDRPVCRSVHWSVHYVFVKSLKMEKKAHDCCTRGREWHSTTCMHASAPWSVGRAVGRPARTPYLVKLFFLVRRELPCIGWSGGSEWNYDMFIICCLQHQPNKLVMVVIANYRLALAPMILSVWIYWLCLYCIIWMKPQNVHNLISTQHTCDGYYR